MLESFCDFFDALGNVDDDAESILSHCAVDALISLVRNVYGKVPSEILRSCFIRREDGSPEGAWTLDRKRNFSEVFKATFTN